MPIPLGDRVNILRCESWKYEVWILGLPRQSLGFIQGEPEHALSGFELAARLGENRIFSLPDLRENLTARSQAEHAERASATGFHPNIVCLVRLHILICLSSYVITVVTHSHKKRDCQMQLFLTHPADAFTLPITSAKVVFSRSRSKALWADAKILSRVFRMHLPTGQAALGFREGLAKGSAFSTAR